jgi:hypothetical protein
MPKGIVPVVTLLVIASVFSQFGGSGLPLSLSSGLAGTLTSAATPASSNSAESRKSANSPKVNPSDYCKDLTPCLPRADLGPWNASCNYARARQDTVRRSPMVALDLGKPIAPALPRIANAPEILDPLAPPDSSHNDSLERWCLSNATLSITTVIVTLPDPVNSHLALDFDRRIDALQAAALDAQYVLDQFWLPWIASENVSPEDSDKTGKDRVLRRLRQNQPGLQIFRSRQSPEPKALFVFLVGETPTQGVNLAQFHNAIDYVREVQTAARQSTTSEIKILGPGYSGSIPILAENLEHQIDGNACCFEVISSSATDHDLLCALHGSVYGAGTIHSVLHNDDASLERFLTYADRVLKVHPEEIAVVSESQTAFGSGEFTLKSATPEHFTPCTHKLDDEANSLRARALRLSFPREIYRLRSAYPDQARISAGSARSNAQPSSGLTLNLKTYAGREDDLPSFSREQLPMSQEALLLNIAETIHRRKIKMVGVAASDIFDTLFVMRFLAEFSPDVRLFLLDSDLLLIRAADNLSLQGTLAITDYPLSSSIQSWQSQANAIRNFPSRSAEVTYNGFLALIGKSDRMLDYSLSEPDAKDKTREPLLWLTVVSRNGFQPIQILPRAAHEGESLSFVIPHSPGKPLFPHPDLPSGGYLLLCGGLIAVTATQVVMAYFGNRAKSKFLGWTIEFFHVCEDSPAHTQKAYLLTTSYLILAVLNFMVFLPVWRVTHFRMQQHMGSGWYVFLSVVTLLVVFASLVAALWFSAIHRLHRSKELVWLILSWLIAAGYYSIWCIFAWPDSFPAQFFIQRSLDLSNGTSPLLPHLLLFISFYLWALTNLRRVHLWETRSQKVRFSSLNKPYRSYFGVLARDLDTYFKDLLFSKSSWIVLALVIGSLIALRPFSHVAGFEPFVLFKGNLFDGLYVTYLLLATTFLIHSLLRFIVAWAALQKILRRLERLPLRHAFDRLPKKFYSWTPLWHSGGARRTFALQTRALESLRKLQSYGESSALPLELKRDLPGLVQGFQNQTTQLLTDEADGSLDLKNDNESCERSMGAIANRLTKEFLIPYWLKTGACESLGSGDKKDSGKADSGVRYLRRDSPPPPDDSVVIAEEFVALRFVSFMRYVGIQLRNLLSFVAAGFILCVASVRSYPFLGHRTIGWALTLIFIALGVPVVIAFAQMDKDAILSRLADTQPGKLDSAFYTRLVSYGALPLLTVMASQFPAIGRFLFSWVQPAIEALH